MPISSLSFGERSFRRIVAPASAVNRYRPPDELETVTMATRFVAKVQESPFQDRVLLAEFGSATAEQRFRHRRRVTVAGREVWLPTAEDVIITKLRWSLTGDTFPRSRRRPRRDRRSGRPHRLGLCPFLVRSARNQRVARRDPPIDSADLKPLGALCLFAAASPCSRPLLLQAVGKHLYAPVAERSQGLLELLVLRGRCFPRSGFAPAGEAGSRSSRSSSRKTVSPRSSSRLVRSRAVSERCSPCRSMPPAPTSVRMLSPISAARRSATSARGLCRPRSCRTANGCSDRPIRPPG